MQIWLRPYFSRCNLHYSGFVTNFDSLTAFISRLANWATTLRQTGVTFITIMDLGRFFVGELRIGTLAYIFSTDRSLRIAFISLPFVALHRLYQSSRAMSLKEFYSIFSIKNFKAVGNVYGVGSKFIHEQASCSNGKAIGCPLDQN